MARKALSALKIDQIFDREETARKYDGHIARYAGMLSKRFITLIGEKGTSSGRLLDAGCGPGHITVELAMAFPELIVTGTDLGDPVLEIARSKAASAGVTGRVELIPDDAQQMQFEDNSYDIVVSANMLHMVDNPVDMLNEIERVLRPGGMFIISNITRSWWLSMLSKAFKASYTASEATDIFKQSGIRPWKVSKGLLDYTFISK